MRLILTTLAILCTFSLSAAAQEFKVGFGSDGADLSAPIEIEANSLSVDQASGNATFEGDVMIAQGEMKLMAQLVNVIYLADNSGIAKLLASGGVSIASGSDRAESDTAEYDVESGLIKMAGNVSLVQQGATLTAGTMDVNLSNNTAELHGRVRTVLQPGRN